jgi:hypothetical protein
MKRTSSVLLASIAACGLGNTPTPEGTTTNWTYTSATAPEIASGKPSPGTPATGDATFTTPEGVVVSFHATAGGLDFARDGKPEHGDVPLTIDVKVIANKDGWTVTPKVSDGPYPYMNGPFSMKHATVEVVLHRIKKGIFSSDLTEEYSVDVFGDARIEETHTTAPPALRKS